MWGTEKDNLVKGQYRLQTMFLNIILLLPDLDFGWNIYGKAEAAVFVLCWPPNT